MYSTVIQWRCSFCKSNDSSSLIFMRKTPSIKRPLSADKTLRITFPVRHANKNNKESCRLNAFKRRIDSNRLIFMCRHTVIFSTSIDEWQSQGGRLRHQDSTTSRFVKKIHLVVLGEYVKLVTGLSSTLLFVVFYKVKCIRCPLAMKEFSR